MQGKNYLYAKLRKLRTFNTVFGYETAQHRKELILPKDHDVDALCVAILWNKEIIYFHKDNFYNIDLRARQTRRQYFDNPKKEKGKIRYQVNKCLNGFKKAIWC